MVQIVISEATKESRTIRHKGGVAVGACLIDAKAHRDFASAASDLAARLRRNAATEEHNAAAQSRSREFGRHAAPSQIHTLSIEVHVLPDDVDASKKIPLDSLKAADHTVLDRLNALLPAPLRR